MRLSAREFAFKVATMPESSRPLRLRLGGLTYCLEIDEAIRLATELADAVTELNTHERINHG